MEGRGGKIVEVIDKTAANWEKLALALHFGEHILGIVSRDNTSVVQACQDVLSGWLSLTWRVMQIRHVSCSPSMPEFEQIATLL